MTADLVAWLRARLDERERTARSAAADAGESWSKLWSGTVQVVGDEFMVGDARVASHIVDNDPAVVLADVEAKRRIIDLHEGSHECSTFEDNCTWIDGDIRPWCDTLKLLALPYAGREGYRAEWKP